MNIKINKINRTIKKLELTLIYVFIMMLFFAMGFEKIAVAMLITPLIVLSIRATFLYAKIIFRG